MVENSDNCPLRVNRITHSSVQLTWDSVPGYDNPFYELHTTLNGINSVMFIGNVTTKTITNLFANTVYTFTVNVVSNDNLTKDSNNESVEIGSVTIETQDNTITAADLHSAIRSGRVDNVELILMKNSLVANVSDPHDTSPLMMAANRGHKEIVRLLLRYGADPFIGKTSGKGIVEMICFNGNLAILKTIVSHYNNLWQLCAQHGNLPLHWALEGKHRELISWMLHHGANVDEDDEANGWTPLFRLAVCGGSPRLAKLLLRHGADVNRRNKNGCTILMAATLSGNDELVDCLLEAGANVSMTTKYGKTAIDFAKGFERYSILKKLMIYRGRKVNKK